MKNVNIGAGWRKETESGVNFISAKLNNDSHFAIFQNTSKKTDKQPDYNFIMDWETAEKMGLISEYDVKKAAEEAETPGVDGVKTSDIPF